MLVKASTKAGHILGSLWISPQALDILSVPLASGQHTTIDNQAPSLSPQDTRHPATAHTGDDHVGFQAHSIALGGLQAFLRASKASVIALHT